MSTAAALLTREQVLAAIDQLEQVITEWSEREDAPRQPWAGGMVKVPDQAFELSSMRLIQLCDTLEAEDDAKPLILAVDRWEDEITAWAQGRRDARGSTAPNGTHEMWQAYNALLLAREPRRDKPPTPIEALFAQNVSANQIALEYGFFEHGQPSPRMVHEERAEPGKHYKKDTWQSPTFSRYWREIHEKWAARRDRVGGFAEMVESAETIEAIREEERKQQVRKEAPESLDELIRTRVPIHQILLMKPGETKESIERRASHLGVGLHDSAWSYLNATETLKPTPPQQESEQAYQQAMEAAGINTYPELGDRNARVLAMAADGHKSIAIASHLSVEYDGLTRQSVNGIIGKAKQKAAKEKAGQEKADEPEEDR